MLEDSDQPTPKQIVEEYFSFLNVLGDRLRTGVRKENQHEDSPLLDTHPGLAILFRTLSNASETPRLVPLRNLEEWNPLSQRVLLSDEHPLKVSKFEEDFTLVPMHIQTFLEWAHEAIHILVFEEWFTGNVPIETQSQFTRWQLAGEALAFWYVDIYLTRSVRDVVPNAELTYNRSSISNCGFHPEQAFKEIGLNDSLSILPIYVDAFLGDTAALEQSNHPFCKTYGKRLGGFYKDSRISLSSLYSVMQDMDIFQEFYDRFCNLPNMPSLSQSLTDSSTLGEEDGISSRILNWGKYGL